MKNIRFYIDLITEGPQDRGNNMAIFLMGSPGSGKDYMAKLILGLENRITPSGLTEINLDRYVDPKLNAMTKAKTLPTDKAEYDKVVDQLHKKSWGPIQSLTDTQLALNKGLILNYTGSNRSAMMGIKNDLESKGYKTAALYVISSLEAAHARNKSRPRAISAEVLTDKWYDVNGNIQYFSGEFHPHFYQIVNDVDFEKGNPAAIKIKLQQVEDLRKKFNRFLQS